VQRNVINTKVNPSKEEAQAFENRKNEIFRLHARRMSIDKQLSKANTQVLELQAKLDTYDSTYNSSSDPIVTRANELLTKSELAKKFLNSLEEKASAAELI